MGKKGVSTVSGNLSPVVGMRQIYHISGWYPNTPASDRDISKVIWELFKKRRNGKFTTTNIRKKGIGEFTFGKHFIGNTWPLERYQF